MSTTMTPPAESSPATLAPKFDIPTEPAQYAEWKKTGTLPTSTPKKEDSASSKEASAEGEKPEEKTAPGSEPGKQSQDQKRSTAESRLTTLLAELKEAGLTPAQLKTFKNDYQRKEEKKAEPEHPAPEQTAKPAADLKAPVKPKAEDFEGKPWAEYEAARDKYFEDLADYKAAKALETHTLRQREEAVTRELQTKLTEAEGRYGSEARTVIGKASSEIFNDQKVNGTVKALLNDSPHIVDVLYALNSGDRSLADFIKDASQNPGQAIRTLVLVEKLVTDELAKGSKETKETKPETQRDQTGKFTTPEKNETKAPPPPAELGSQRAAPPDDSAEAFKRGDARAFIEAENRKEIARRKGR